MLHKLTAVLMAIIFGFTYAAYAFTTAISDSTGNNIANVTGGALNVTGNLTGTVTGNVSITGTANTTLGATFNVTNITTSANSTSLVIGPSATWYSRSIQMSPKSKYHALCSSCNGVDLNLTARWEQGIAAPSTEGSADNSWQVAVNSALTTQDIYTSNTASNRNVAFSPLSLEYGRLVFVNNKAATATCAAQYSVIKEQ